MNCRPLRMLLLFMATLGVANDLRAGERELSAEAMHRAIEGFWIGQLVGNFVGFPFENLYTDEPIPILIDRYFTFRDAEPYGLLMNLDDRRAYIDIMADALGGAWSDDDTDIEWVYLHAVERYGLELTYEQVVKMWKAHINRYVWSANLEARRLMDEGLVPPDTGSRKHNEYWYRISSQLTTEIWGVFHPGMTRRGGARAQWAGRVSTDGWATHPDLFYGTLFSAAYFEHDVETLVRLGRDALPEDSPFRRAIDEVLAWRKHIDDWRTVRQLLHERYYEEVDGFTIPTPVVGSVINGLGSVVALLYGGGDFTKTVGIATSFGYDCDNQAATCGGLIGMIVGVENIPERFTHEMPSRGRWEKPFNDTYINYSRDGLPAFNRISDIVARTQAVAEQAIFLGGGRRIETEDGVVFLVPTDLPGN